MPLSVKQIESLATPGKHSDGTVPGLYLEVSKAGGKLWRLKYRLHGKENRYALGAYPDIGLKEARALAQQARTDVALGTPPLKARQAKAEKHRAEQVLTFQKVAEQWLDTVKAPKLVSKSLAGFKGALANHVYPVLGGKPVAQVRLEHVREVVTRLTGQGKSAMAKRCLTIVRAVLGFSLGRGWVTANVALGHSEELEIRHVVTHAAAIERPNELGRYLCKLDDAGNGSVAQALRLLALIPCRPGELAVARWEDIDLQDASWRYIVSKTRHVKQDKHIAVLSSQALEVLRQLQQSRVVNSKGQGWLLPSPVHPGEPITPDAMLRAAQRLWPERKMSAHGFRSTFRTLAHEELEVDPIVLELMLSHKMPGALGATYARAQLLKQRREAAQRWANYLDGLRAKARGAG